MGVAQFRVWFGSNQASADDLDRIEEIEVTQELDRFWEARMRMTMCLDAQGRWQHRPDTVAAPFSRVRVELDPGSGTFVPLIDGPVVRFESQLDSQPGRSTATFAVRDDSVLLDREHGTEVFRDKTDSQIADEVLRSVPAIAEARTSPATTATHPITSRRGTKLTLLSQLAHANARRVYVLPGAERGQSIGCFLPDPAEADPGLPALKLIGDDRNLEDATIEEDSESPEQSHGSTLRLSDGQVASFQSSAADLSISNDAPVLSSQDAPSRLLPPADALRDDLTDATQRRARDAAYGFKLTSSVVPGCYAAVLSPYLKARVECGSTPYSGTYLITKVVHRITPSIYTQHFEARSDGRTTVPDAPVAEVAGGGLSVSFSASVGVF